MEYEAMDAETVAGLLGESGVSTRQLRNYCNLGCPYEERGRQRVFQWHKVLAWYVAFKNGGMTTADIPEPALDDTPARNENQTQANLRKTRAEADLKQLALAKLRGQVIGIDEARGILDRMFGNLKAQLLGAAPLLNTRLVGEADDAAREAAIRAFMENLCQELSTGKIVRDAADPEEPKTDDEPIDNIEAAADITDADVNRVVAEYLAANAAEQVFQYA